MIERAVKSKLKTLLVMLLVLGMMSQSVAPAFAFTTGDQTTSGNTAKDSLNYLTSLRQNLAVFLYDGQNREFVLDRDELTGTVTAEKGKLYKKPEYAEEQNAGYEGMSVTKAYSQIFRRTQVAWNAPGAKESLMLFGPDLYWFGTGPGGGITVSATGNGSLSHEYYMAHRMGYKPSDVPSGLQLYLRDLKGGWFSSWGAMPNGVFKEQIAEYLDRYFANPTGEKKPDAFIQELIQNASGDDKLQAFRIWAYIGAGPDAAADGIEDNAAGISTISSANSRWVQAFEGGTSSFNAGDVFIGKDGLQEMKDGVLKPIGDDAGDKTRVYNHVAAYIDTLLTLNLVAGLNGQPGIGEKYISAATECFGSPGAYVSEVSDIKQSKSIVFDTWSTQCYTAIGQASKGTVVTYTDNWGMYRRAYHAAGGTPVSDWRSLNPMYNDYTATSLADNSTNLKEWSAKVPESTDRIGIRLSLLSDEFDASQKVNESNIDLSIFTIWMPALVGLGTVSSSLGRHNTSSTNDTILSGLKGFHGGLFNHRYLGLDSTRLDMVGGQSIIGMFAQVLDTQLQGNTHSIVATPDGTPAVNPNVNGLNKTARVVYNIGNTFKENIASTDKVLLDTAMGVFTAAQGTGDKLFGRTYTTRQVKKYYLNTLWIADSVGNKPAIAVTAGLGPDSAATDLPPIKTALGYNTIPKASFDSPTTGWSEIPLNTYRDLLTTKGGLMYDYNDAAYMSKQWSATPQAETFKTTITEGGGKVVYQYTPGHDYYLEIEYVADTQFKLAKTATETPTKMTQYGGEIGESPFLLFSTTTKVEPASDLASFQTKKEAIRTRKDLPLEPLIKESLPYAVYSSSPEAYAELKNWGVSSMDEPGDMTGLGDDRSPMDTDLGVTSAVKSNGSSVITEDYEAMAGVPTTEKLYLAVGGSEFIVDIAVQYVPNETAVRSYTAHFDGVPSQFNYASPSGAGGDTPDATVFSGYPTSGKGSVSGTWTHEGGTITYIASGSIDASGTAVNTGGGAGTHAGGGNPWSITATATATTAPAKTNTSNTATSKTEIKVIPNGGDVANFNATGLDAQKWMDDMNAWIAGLKFQSGSDKTLRQIPNSPGGAWTPSNTTLTGVQAASGSYSKAPNAKFSVVENDGTETSFSVVECSGMSMSVTNPRDLSCSGSDTDTNTYKPPIPAKPAGPGGVPAAVPAVPEEDKHSHSSSPGSASQSKPTWSVTITYTLKPHVLCGPECGHNLPEINDVWQQSINYDYLKIIGLSILRLDQGAAGDTNTDLSGLNALIGTEKLGVTRQTYYSSPTMSLAQANIFNYMGLQTDGKQDVYKATNEYFRSIAYGIGTTWGNTKSSEANRVKYWMTNADGSRLTAKGPTFQRLTYKGNTASSAPFANEVLSEWGEGNYKANDYVAYNFGARSNLSDGTSRGYTYNVNKSSWVEKVNGVWRGKAAYDLPWAKGFIYDGVRANGAIDASGFSVSRQYRNTSRGGGTGLEGIAQDGVKGWQGKGMTTTTLNFKTESYTPETTGKLFRAEYYKGSQKVENRLKQPAIRDWGTAYHTTYRDSRNLIEPGGLTMPGAELGDLSPTKSVSKIWQDTAIKTDDRFAQAQPYDTSDMLTAYTNTASDSGAIIRATNEYKVLFAKRSELVQATVISDAVVLDLPNGLQPIMYHYKNAPAQAQAEERLPDTRSTFNELWHNNMFTPNGWASTTRGSLQDGVILGSYNGDLTTPPTMGLSDVQKRLQWRADELPATANLFIQNKTAAIEAPGGVIGAKLGAKIINGTNINLYLAHNGAAQTRILSLPVTNKAAVGASVQRTLLYNVTPILLSAKNREYDTGSAEAFWETIVQWKDSSNHDYYGPYVDGVGTLEPDVYIKDGDFIRLPELLGNYGQVQSKDMVDKVGALSATLQDYFVDSNNLKAYGAEDARLAQTEQVVRGFGVTGYNYDTTNTKAIAGKYHKNMYNQSVDLTGAAKGESYVTDGNFGVPFILEGITTAGFKTDTATKTVGSLPAGVPKSGYIQKTAYTREDAIKGNYGLNDVVIHNPVTARAVQVMPIAEWRDQRTVGQSLVSKVRDNLNTGCPEIVELCEFAVLDEKYDKPLELLALNLVGSGKSVVNTAKNAITTGNIEFAGSYAMSGTGLSSNGSPRTGISLTKLGGSYYSSLDYQVTAPITYTANTGEQMLFGFEGYGITLNTATKKLAIRVSGLTGYIDVAGTFNSGDTLKVQFGCANAALSKVWVNDSLRTITVAGGATFETMSIGKNNVGDVFYIGSWKSGDYPPTASTRYKSVLLERLAGSHQHTLACMTTVTNHVGGNNTHIHAVSDLGPSDSIKYLNGTLRDWNNYVIDDATLRERLGDVVWTALGLPKAQTTVITDSDVTLTATPTVTNFNTVGTHTYVAPQDGQYKLETWGAAGGGDTPRTVTVAAPSSTGSQSFNYTGGVQTFTAPIAGTYTLEVWGAQGGTAGTGVGGKGGYSKGTVSLAAGETIYVSVGGQPNGNPNVGGFNGGGTSNAAAGGGGATHVAKVNGNLSSLITNKSSILIVAGGGGGGGTTLRPVESHVGGTGGGVTGGGGTGSRAGSGGTQTAGGTDSSNTLPGSFGKGGSGQGHGTAGGGGYFGGGGGYSCSAGGGGGSGYIGGVSGGTMSNGVRAGHGTATISWSVAGTSATGPVGSVGGKGGYSSGYVTLKKGDVVTINVGGQGTQAAANTYGGGGFNGGGNGANTGFGGGGATDIRVSGQTDVISGANVNIGKFAANLTTSGNPSMVTLATGETAIKINAGSQHMAAVVPNVFTAGHVYQISFEAWTTSTSDIIYVDAYPDTLPEAKIPITSQRKTYTTTLTSNLAAMTGAAFRVFSSSGALKGDVYITNIKVKDASSPSSRVIVAGGGGGADDASGELAGTANDGSGGAGGGLHGESAYLNGTRVEMKTFGGATWARIFHQDTSDGTYFTGKDAAAYSMTHKRFSMLKLLSNVTSSTGKYEFLLEYPGLTGYNRWRQTLNPVTAAVETTAGGAAGGYEPISITWPDQYGGGGLVKSSQPAALLDGNTNKTDWWFAIGQVMQYTTDPTVMPGPPVVHVKKVDLWLRVDNIHYDTPAINGGGLGLGGTQSSGYALGQGESASYMTDTGGGGGGYYGGYTSNHNNGGAGGGSGYIGGVTSGTTKAGVQAGNGKAVITAPPSVTSKAITFTVTGSPKQFDATAILKSGTGMLQLELYEGNTATPSKLIDSAVGNPNIIYPSARQKFGYTGNVQTFTAPQTGTYTLETWGAQGGTGDGNVNGIGLGGYAKGTYNLTAGQSINIYVGGAGGSNGGAGGWNGGGSAVTVPGAGHQGGAGGGATDIRVGGTALTNRILVAGGGGGGAPTCGGSHITAGHGGAAEGTQSTNTAGPYAISYATGGTQSAGGTGQGYYNGAGAGWKANGTLGQGANVLGQCGAGGGGGYYGGGSSFTAGGGGGSGYRAKVGSGYMQSGLNTGNGRAVISWQGKATPTTLKAGTYTVVLKNLDATTVTASLKATLTGRDLKYTDIMSLPNIGGAEAWRKIPYYLSDGSRNPLYACNGELNAHKCDVDQTQSFDYTGGVQKFTAPVDGEYTFEAWGAQGGGSTSGYTGAGNNIAAGTRVEGGLGGYSKGTVTLKAGQTVNVYVGGKGSDGVPAGTATNGSRTAGGWNGGGSGAPYYQQGGGGGGATDIRTTTSSKTYSNWQSGNTQGFVTAGSSTLSVSGGNLVVTMTGSSWEMKVPYSLPDASRILEIKVVLDNNTPYTGAGVNISTSASKYTGAKAKANTANQTLSFYPNWTGPMSEIYFDFFSGAPSGNTVIKSIEIILGDKVIVAGGGGGSSNWVNAVEGGAGGGLTGGSGKLNTGAAAHPLATGGTQTSGGTAGGLYPGTPGSLGAGGDSQLSHGGGGGGGYYGGGGSGYIASGVSSAGGGSGFIGGVSEGSMQSGVRKGNGSVLVTWSEATLCFTEVTADKCTEPHHTGGHYEGDPLCYTPCFDDHKHDTDFVQNQKVNEHAATFVSIDWDYTLYADSLDNFRTSTAHQIVNPLESTGLGYYDTNINGEFDVVRFVRGKYVKFPWIALYDGVLYNPGEWVVLGDRGDYAQGSVSRGNTATGLGGNVQSGVNGASDLWDSEQAAAYNVQNWSNYNQQIYKDLYKDFYDFYVPLSNAEISLGDVTYAMVAVNAPDGREPVYQAGLPAVLSETSNIYDWLRGNLVSNRTRDMNIAALGAGKVFYVDVVGRIGGLVIEDTTDVKFSNTFKEALTLDSDTKVTYDIDVTDLTGTKAGRTTQALALSESIITGGKFVTSGSSTRASLTEVSDWVGFDYAGGNARKYVVTVNGNNLQAGELIVSVYDASNEDYTLRMSDMTVTQNTNQTITVEFDVKQTNAAVVVKPRFSVIDTDVVGLEVLNMTIALGGSGFNQGLNKTVDETKQNYYVTDLTDVRGIYLGSTLERESAVEGKGALAWSRYDSFKATADWIRISNSTQVRDADHISQRATPTYGTRAVNTYGTRPWVQIGDPLYKALANSGGKALVGPISASQNVVSQYRNNKDQISVGSKIFFDITTLGSYVDMGANLKIIPTYYLVDTTKQDASGAVALIPVDVYQFSSSGNYQPVNIFGAPYGGFTDTEIDAFNQYRISVNWEEEAVANNNRRMVTNEEKHAARAYSDLFTDMDYGDTNPYAAVDFENPNTIPQTNTRTASPRRVPEGVMQIGGSQFIQQGYQTQTYIGSNFTYGVDKSGGLFAPYAADPTENQKYIYWQVSAQRWHSALALPSDSMFVPLAQDPVTHKFIHRDKADIPVHAVDISESLIIAYIDVYAEGTVWTLHYGHQGLQRTVTIDGVDYKLPIAGPAGPAMANPYPGQTVVGEAHTNGGIPIGVFGGTRVETQTDIIKVN